MRPTCRYLGVWHNFCLMSGVPNHVSELCESPHYPVSCPNSQKLFFIHLLPPSPLSRSDTLQLYSISNFHPHCLPFLPIAISLVYPFLDDGRNILLNLLLGHISFYLLFTLLSGIIFVKSKYGFHPWVFEKFSSASVVKLVTARWDKRSLLLGPHLTFVLRFWHFPTDSPYNLVTLFLEVIQMHYFFSWSLKEELKSPVVSII